jgi:DNA-binding PadR family transcriptional regulator
MGDQLETMRMELRRGVLVLSVLATLRREHYGYSLRKELIAEGIDIEEGTLYPLVRRLEGYGLLESEWRTEEGRRKRYYVISAAGEELLAALTEEWRATNASVRALLEETE